MRYLPWLPAAVLSVALPAGAGPLDDLLRETREQIEHAAAIDQQRLAQFLAARDGRREILAAVGQELAAETTRGEELKARFDRNDAELAELEETKRVRVGDMGELFGVVRQVAGDASSLVTASLVTAQYPGRGGDLLGRLADARALPSIAELDALRVLLLEEMVESGKVVRFPGTIVDAAGERQDSEIVRVGVFNLVAGDRFLEYEQDNGTIQELARQPAPRFRALAGGLFDAAEGVVPMAVDPTYGGLLGLLIQTPDRAERIQQGGLVGYIIIGLGLLGLLLALERFGYLSVAGARIARQLKAADLPSDDNALGRVLRVYAENRDTDTETLELKLDEAILRETPPLERRQAAIKVLAAVAPLLGLLGTVIGMIETFQQITLFGTGDPKLMAGGISKALVTTMFGLFVAIPLVLLHSVVAGWSKRLIEVLEEQSAGIVAAQSERRL